MLLHVLFTFGVGCFFAEANVVFPCTTPNNEQAHCVSLFSCPVLIQSISSSDPSTIEFVKQSLCRGDACRHRDITVCCGTSGNFVEPILQVINDRNQKPNVSSSDGSKKKDKKPSASAIQNTQPQTPEEAHRDFVRSKLIPSRTYCGLQHTDDRVYNNSEIALDEHPWLVDVKWYNNEDHHRYDERCTGVLISNRYVLTNWLCGYDAKRVRLGQYIVDKNISCIEDPQFPECTEPTLKVNISEKFRYRQPSRSGSYNFVLLRLENKINYNDYIRPICLPIDEDVRSQRPTSLAFTGWGSNDASALAKKRLVYDVAPEDVCYKEHDYLEGNIKSAKVELVCLARQKNGSTTIPACNGDHGTPLTYSHNRQWFAQGLFVSVIPDSPSDACSSERTVTGIGITPEVINWIMDHMRR